jgi:hypothetical protein
MELEQFLLKLKECKKSQIMTGYSDRIGDLRITVNLDRTIFHIDKKQEKKICSKCGCDLTKQENNEIIVRFNKKQDNLTIFQTYLLFMIYKFKLIPYDYASYHKCIAGQEFIKNIKEVTQ